MTTECSYKAHSAISGWHLFFCGLCMGAADLVPGVSGGTIAFILGFYQPLLNSLKTLNYVALQHLLKRRWHLFAQQVAWKFLLTLLAGIACAFVAFTHFLHIILAHEVYRLYLYATFLGFILASFAFCVRQVKEWDWQKMVGLGIGGVAAYFLTGVTSTCSEGEYAVPIRIETQHLSLRNYDVQRHLLMGLSTQTLSHLAARGLVQETTPVYHQQGMLIGHVKDLTTPMRPTFFNGWLILCGALAMCALLLPGISGSYMLTLLGVYPIAINALVDCFTGIRLFTFNPEAFAVLGNLGLGIAIGALGFVRVISWFLCHYPSQGFALLSGFIIGGIRSVWPFWTYEYVLFPLQLAKGPQLMAIHPFLPSWNSPFLWQGLVCTCVGFTLVFALEAYHTITMKAMTRTT